MEGTRQIRIEHKLNSNPQRRLELLLAANAEIAKWKAVYPTRSVEIERSLMTHPLDATQVFKYLGAMLGTFPTAAFFLSFLLSTTGADKGLAAALLAVVTIACTVTGYHSGKVVGTLMTAIGKRSLSFGLLAVPFLGFAWGAVSGAAGGVFIFVIGAFFGAFIGGAVGAAALTAFFLLYRKLTIAGMLELKHFLPVASGVTFSICAYILSFLGG
jgi:hypothetical protein